MLDSGLAGLIPGYKRIYCDFPLPVLVCDRGFDVFWSNAAAMAIYPRFAGGEGLRGAMSLFESEVIFDRLFREGSCRLEGAIAFSDVVLHLSSAMSGGEIVGVVVIFLNAQAVPASDSALRASQTPESLERSIRGSMEEMFASMDATAIKADMAGAGWIKPSLSRISLSAYQILRVATNISTFSHFQNHTPALNLQVVDLIGMFGELAPGIRAFAANSGIPLHMDIPSETAIALADSSRFQLAFFNILHNAFYFTRPGNEVSVLLEKKNGCVAITVTDKGPGIPADILPHVCKPYYSFALAGNPCGVGLGLTLAKRLAEAHEGKIEIASVEGEGTTVTLRLPETTLSQPIRLSQGVDARDLANRFSPMYVGLSDAVLSPHNPLGGEAP